MTCLCAFIQAKGRWRCVQGQVRGTYSHTDSNLSFAFSPLLGGGVLYPGHRHGGDRRKYCQFWNGRYFFLPPGSIHSDHADDGFKNIHYEFEDASFPYHTWIKIRDTDSGDFLSVITRLYNEYQMKRKNYAEIVDSLHDVLLHYLIAFSDQAPHHPCVETAINQIVTNFSDPFYDLSQIMTHIHMNPDYFRKLFKKEMGISPLKYLTQIRISHAKRLLRLKHRSGMSIQEISWLSGFQDSLYFSRVFKKVTGVPPQDWEWIFLGLNLIPNASSEEKKEKFYISLKFYLF